MALAPGTRLGAYEVISLIGEGGMGQVYRARDTKLNRDVAVKILPDTFGFDGDRIARFRREAQVLASLNHPNIAHIYGLEDSSGTHALVLELVEGPTLADRIAKGPIPVDEALPIAKQIAEALEAAHELGIIHRDLKPANIKIRGDGTVKVLDFGLAKALEPASALSPLTNSPTITTPAQMTGAGMLLGTAAYMSPEQARGHAVDKRADVWAFGAVLFEMLSGRRLINEDSVSDALAEVLKGQLPLHALPPDAVVVKPLISRCLTRDPGRRLRDIGEARIVLENAIADPAAAVGMEPSQRLRVSSSTWRRVAPWIVAGSAVAVAIGTTWSHWRVTSAGEPVMRFALDTSTSRPLVLGDGLQLSPDGRRLAIIASEQPGEPPRLHIRKLDELQTLPLQGTEGARHPFFSPDGVWVGFFADGKLKKIGVSGGAALTLCDAPDDRGGSWGDGWIAFTPRPNSPIFRVSQDGGIPTPLTTLGQGEVTHRWSQVLTGSRALLYTTSSATGNYEQASLVVQPLGSGPPKVIQRGGSYGRYLPTGHLMYISQGDLFAAPFDAQRLTVTAQAIPVVRGVQRQPRTGAAQFTFSNDGSFAYVPGAGDARESSLVWVDQDGKTLPLRPQAAGYRELRFSPDGEHLAVTIVEQQSDIWVYDWRKDVLSRLTTHPALDANPNWTPDGKRIAFRSTRDGVDSLYWQRTDGSDSVQRLTDGNFVSVFPLSWHPGGRLLAFRKTGSVSGQDIWLLPLEGDEISGWKPGKPTLLLGGPANEADAAFSPDGSWLAFQSDESGRNEIYVRPFPGPGARTKVSVAGGLAPRWSAKSHKLFYRTEDGKISVVTYSITSNSFHADRTSVVTNGPVSAFDVRPDGQRLAALQSSRTDEPARVVLALHWFDELNQRVPVK